ncbi:hypothetical protein M514_23393 [Trichuris suis]|uniref:BED-type domain-containing protein n=1 Tax=Trichuris suis TaxID=68888 RepID=A0A085MBU4_9BILA|nr:hypothetical protein M513_04390 [Trichuris suis]KFD54692.1 hypothetical protein M513_04392 [Trichuris suis]KFD64369.1 hypothetical protein M514_23393 [Trichuris suis]
MAESKRKCRQYSSDYLKYGFITAPNNKQLLMCLLCNRVFSNESMKPSRLKEHLAKIHLDKAGKDFNYFISLREKFRKRPTLSNMFSTQTASEMDGLRASFNISLMIARSGKAHTNGEELLQPVVSEVLRTVLHMPAAETKAFH